MSEELKRSKEYSSNPQTFNANRLKLSLLKYFWEVSPLAGIQAENIPRFIRKVDVFKALSDLELRLLSTFFHQRDYSDKEVIFSEGDTGFGFYLIYSGKVNICSQDQEEVNKDLVVSLGKGEYFGELALMEKRSRRNAGAVAEGKTNLLVMYNPDLEELIEKHPRVGAKFLQSIGLIISRRFIRISDNLRRAKSELRELKNNGSDEQ